MIAWTERAAYWLMKACMLAGYSTGCTPRRDGSFYVSVRPAQAHFRPAKLAASMFADESTVELP